MVKIKTKKKMTLPELIQWGWDNKSKNREFYSENGKKVIFNSNGNVKPKVYFKLEDTFIVEIEEEITEDTVINGLVEVYRASSGFLKSVMFPRESVRVAKRDVTVAFYMLNDDMTMTLLWRNGGMVE
ncbi:hypothetical protein [Staphylococcus agnetis]|uniref:hypothetical protein n=1 Tax=Staphylococcus agnetis TaxID=985762 RepID=UPI00117EA07E|nr:hypothetical protein [Staphylococcus agnetis]MBY7665059.1 hypothetical protein [Staphylococcus agnetis]TRW80158.1 hypothetical protein FNK43_09485 [Staphylococcus agnetis]